jgi:hypothetical protein
MVVAIDSACLKGVIQTGTAVIRDRERVTLQSAALVAAAAPGFTLPVARAALGTVVFEPGLAGSVLDAAILTLAALLVRAAAAARRFARDTSTGTRSRGAIVATGCFLVASAWPAVVILAERYAFTLATTAARFTLPVARAALGAVVFEPHFTAARTGTAVAVFVGIAAIATGEDLGYFRTHAAVSFLQQRHAHLFAAPPLLLTLPVAGARAYPVVREARHARVRIGTKLRLITSCIVFTAQVAIG